MAKRGGTESLAVMLYNELRAAILHGRLSPGERLKPDELRQTFGVSLGVTREALSLLAAQNLVTVDRNRGFHVIAFSLDALGHLTAARKITEGAALRLSVESGGVAWESELLAAHHRMASEPMVLSDGSGIRSEAWARAHIEFHRKLIDACGNPILIDICDRLSDAAEVYRAWSGPGTLEKHRDVAGEHRALLDAALAHDADLAVTLFYAHIERTNQILSELDIAADGPASPIKIAD